MPTVNSHTYLQDVQRLVREQRQEFVNPEDLLAYINLARREVAARTQCIRRLTPISGQVLQTTLLTAGSGYVTPIATITPPDWASGTLPNPNGRQATALCSMQGPVLTGVDVTDGGDGYFQPQITISDATGPGAGATASIVTTPLNLLNEGQEVYNFSDIYLGNWPGVDSVYAIKSLSVVYAQYRYMVPIYPFSTYQAQVRQFSTATYQYVPSFAAQYGQGAGGSMYVYPPPSQTYQMEFDCFCMPQDMQMDNSIPEAIPMPWCDAVKYMAAQLAFQEIMNFNAAKFYEQQFDKMTLGYSQHARISRGINMYGRY
jgi:hypothetical protein